MWVAHPMADDRSVTFHAEGRIHLSAENLWPEMEMNDQILEAECNLTL
jgi:hypothetical protein